MMLAEFKAWFEGYTEGLEGAPTKAQFNRIKEKVKEINSTPITQTVYLHDYYRPWREYYDRTLTSRGSMTSAQGVSQMTLTNSLPPTEPFNSLAAMYTLGKAEASN